LAYSAKTFDYGSKIESFRQIITNITGLPVVPINSGKLPSYPYITYDYANGGTPETWSNSRELEIFRLNITLDCYADNKPQEAMQIASDIEVLLFDPTYHQQLKKAGIIVVSAVPNSITANDFTSLFSIYVQPLEVSLRLLRNYESDYPRINQTDLGGHTNA